MARSRRGAALTAVVLGAALGGSSCLSRPLQTADTRTTSTVVARLTQSAVDKIDLLIMIDNSRSMADKQQILAAAVPDLVEGLVNPKCVDAKSPYDQDKWVKVGSPTAPCPAGTKREFNPVLDVHIGIITSSIGGHGADACPGSAADVTCPPAAINTTQNDAAHLVTRSDACGGGTIETYGNKGFLAWDPESKASPPGEASIGELTIDQATLATATKTPGLVPSLKDLVLGTGQIGCAFEAQHESWYRFLIDPDPYETITVENGKAVRKDTDGVLLAQRKDFLRPDSLLAIIGLTDENDCSMKEGGDFYYVARSNANMFRARSECKTNPNDKCCLSCAQNQGSCPPDPSCATLELDDNDDDIGLRCWEQKRRFGIDFLYPIDRYVTGLTKPVVPNRAGEMVPNPILPGYDPESPDVAGRDPGLVFLAYIAGVPWQDIARQDKDGKPDLLHGLDADGNPVGGFKTSDELGKADAQGDTVWDKVIGDPANYVPPLDPFMIESTDPRSGTNPFTNDSITPPGAPTGPNAINGHEYTADVDNMGNPAPRDLQYACIFELPEARDCASTDAPCDCINPFNDSPLCDPDPSKPLVTPPNDPTATPVPPRTLQPRAKAYPGTRELSLIKALGTQGIIGSICPKQLTDLSAPDFGYRPAIGAIIDRLKLALGGQCLPRRLRPNEDGQVQCLILEGRATKGEHKGDCATFCDGLPARQRVQPEHQPAVDSETVQTAAKQAGLDCFCEIQQLRGETTGACADDIQPKSALDACQCLTANPPSFGGADVDGWCYVDATTTPPVGNADLVKSCPVTEQRLVRFVGKGNPEPNSTLFITCAGE